jgi:putative NADH-flavin reductase
MRVCILGAPGKLGKYMVQHALDRGYEVVACRGFESLVRHLPYRA